MCFGSHHSYQLTIIVIAVVGTSSTSASHLISASPSSMDPLPLFRVICALRMTYTEGHIRSMPEIRSWQTPRASRVFTLHRQCFGFIANFYYRYKLQVSRATERTSARARTSLSFILFSSFRFIARTFLLLAFCYVFCFVYSFALFCRNRVSFGAKDLSQSFNSLSA